jgi:hypothetical protein
METSSKGRHCDRSCSKRASSLPPLQASCSLDLPQAGQEDQGAEMSQLKGEVQDLLKGLSSYEDDMQAEKAEAARRKKMREKTAAKAMQASDADSVQTTELSDGVRDLYQNVSRLDDHRKEQEGLRQLVANRNIKDVKRHLQKRQQSGVPVSTGQVVESTQKHLSAMYKQHRQVSDLKKLMAELSTSTPPDDMPDLD